jgi:hypothetical protein
MKSLIRRLFSLPTSSRSDMSIVLRFAALQHQTVRLTFGPVGSELSTYLPATIEWKQLNYGQGEGQVLIAGCEWGLYWYNSTDLALVLHSGEVDLSTAVELARSIGLRLQPLMGKCSMHLRATVTQQ